MFGQQRTVVSWDVEYLPALDINYWDENGDGLIERPNTDYSNEMRAVWESFLASMQYDPVQQGQAYLFVIPGITEGGDVRGYMPIKSRYGFVTAEASTRDVAHELGHGVFNLRHTFSEENSFTLPQGDTDNLMDYSTGTELWKYQWDFIHGPEGGWFIFEDVREAESTVINDLVENIITDLRDGNLGGLTELDLLNYCTIDAMAGVTIQEWSTVDFGNDNVFDVSLTLHSVREDEEANIIDITAFEEEEYHRNYMTDQASIDEMCYTVSFDYKNRGGVGLEMAVPVEQKESFKDYLLGALLAQYSMAADTAMSCAFSWSGNDMACNIGVRTAIYFYKNNQLLFPKSPGSGLFKSNQEPYLIGEITKPGKANDIYNDLENEELSKFEPISNATECSYPDFDELQDQANNGVAIIGVRENSSGSGHIVLIMPKSFNQGNEPTSFSIGLRTVKYPICLECGFGDKKVEPFRDKGNISEYKWYKY